MDKSVARCDNEPPRNMRISRLNLRRHMSRRFVDQFEITQCRIVDEAVVDKLVLRETCRIGAGFLRKAQHVTDIDPPFTTVTRHARLRFL